MTVVPRREQYRRTIAFGRGILAPGIVLLNMGGDLGGLAVFLIILGAGGIAGGLIMLLLGSRDETD